MIVDTNFTEFKFLFSTQFTCFCYYGGGILSSLIVVVSVPPKIVTAHAAVAVVLILVMLAVSLSIVPLRTGVAVAVDVAVVVDFVAVTVAVAVDVAAVVAVAVASLATSKCFLLHFLLSLSFSPTLLPPPVRLTIQSLSSVSATIYIYILVHLDRVTWSLRTSWLCSVFFFCAFLLLLFPDRIATPPSPDDFVL